MRQIFTVIIAFVVLFSIQGCGTFKGAVDGLHDDIDGFQSRDNELQKTDEWLEENLW